MADTDTGVVELRDDYYRDSFGKLILIMASMVVAIILLLATSFYLFVTEPPPIRFAVSEEWRVQQDVPLEQPYLATPILLQWVSDALLNVFQLDFVGYNEQLKRASPYFTDDGWRIFLDQLNNYANYNNVQNKKMFIKSEPNSAPVILNSGVLTGRWAWLIQAPITLRYVSNDGASSQSLNLQVTVVRVPTANNLMGVGIDNIIVSQGNTGTKAGAEQ